MNTIRSKSGQKMYLLIAICVGSGQIKKKYTGFFMCVKSADFLFFQNFVKSKFKLVFFF